MLIFNFFQAVVKKSLPHFVYLMLTVYRTKASHPSSYKLRFSATCISLSYKGILFHTLEVIAHERERERALLNDKIKTLPLIRLPI